MTLLTCFGSARGATFSEVLVAMALAFIGLTGAMGAFHVADKAIVQSMLASRALGMAESRLEAKRSVRWDQLLTDDLDHDGIPEILMRDDGTDGDFAAGDGIYSARAELNAVVLIWTVAPNHGGSLSESGFAVLEARATYRSDDGEHEVRLATVRANSVFAGGQ
ncbi:MAG TPA: choice-of-anchor X domain-containing protein [Nitrospira sp.]